MTAQFSRFMAVESSEVGYYNKFTTSEFYDLLLIRIRMYNIVRADVQPSGVQAGTHIRICFVFSFKYSLDPLSSFPLDVVRTLVQ
jgi:hypothetical protein